MNKHFDYDYVKSVYEKMNYTFFNSGQFNLNVFAIRSNNRVSNKFDDYVCLAYKDERDKKIVKVYDATTDPGSYYLENPMNVDGTAIVVPGQYSKSHTLGLHKGQYEALVQRGIIKVYRDNNKDNILDLDPLSIRSGSGYGINIHRATPNKGKKSTQIDRWSAGCSVIAAKDDFDEFISIVKKSIPLYGNSFTYTLFTEDQFFV